MNRKQQKTLNAVQSRPTKHMQIKWTDVASLIKGLGGEIGQGNGSRVRIVLNDRSANIHTPHPHKELKAYQVDAVRELLTESE